MVQGPDTKRYVHPGFHRVFGRIEQYGSYLLGIPTFLAGAYLALVDWNILPLAGGLVGAYLLSAIGENGEKRVKRSRLPAAPSRRRARVSA